MDYKNAEVRLSLNLAGRQAIRGSYSHFHKVGRTGDDINGVHVDRKPVFTEAKKTVRLSNFFVRCALDEPTEGLKRKIKPSFWNKIPPEKRIELHVAAYVRAFHPEHRGYEMEIL
jgi:hypothetical protein